MNRRLGIGSNHALCAAVGASEKVLDVLPDQLFHLALLTKRERRDISAHPCLFRRWRSDELRLLIRLMRRAGELLGLVAALCYFLPGSRSLLVHLACSFGRNMELERFDGVVLQLDRT